MAHGRSPPAELDVHLIADNYAAHKTALIRNWFAKRPASIFISHPPAPPQLGKLGIYDTTRV